MLTNTASATDSPMTDSIQQPPSDVDSSEPSRRGIEWRTRYEGVVTVAYIGDKAVAGISGPWSDKFALTWWERPLPARQLELFDTLDDAIREVEDWALRMRTGYPSLPGVQTREPAAAVAAAKPSLLEQMRAMLPGFGHKRTRPSSRETIEHLRQRRAYDDTDIGNLHFAANE